MKKLVITVTLIIIGYSAFPQWIRTNGPYGCPAYCIASNGTSIFIGTKFGVYKSNNNGVNWAAANNGLPSDVDVRAIVIKGTNIFAGTYNYGIYKSTDNAVSWTVVNSGLTDLCIHKMAVYNNYILAGTDLYGIFKSTNNGATWSAANSGLPSDEITSITIFGKNILVGTYYYGVFLSTDSTTSWTAVNTGLSTSPNVNSLANDGLIVYVGSGIGKIYSSIDTGATWVESCSGIPTSAYVSSLMINNNKIYAGTYKGLYVSTNNGLNWSLANSIFTNVYIYTIAACGTTIFASSVNGLYKSIDDGATWNPVGNGIPTDIYALAVKGTNIFASTKAQVFLSTNGGSSWISKSGNGLCCSEVNSIAVNGNYVFAANSDGVFRSANNGTSWTACPNIFWGKALATCGSKLITKSNGIEISTSYGSSWSLGSGTGNSNIFCFAGNDTTVYAGTNNGIYVSTDGGYTFGAKESRSYWDIYAIGVSGSNAFLGAHGHTDGLTYYPGGLYLYNGTSAVAVTNGLTNIDVNAIIVFGIYVFVGTDNGVFLSSNNGANWTPINTGLTDTYIRSFAICGDTLYAGTHQGVWKRSLSEMVVVVGTNDDLSQNKLLIHPNPASTSITVENIPTGNNNKLSVYNIQGELIIQKQLYQEKTEINISNLPNGIYILKIEGFDGVKVRKFIKE